MPRLLAKRINSFSSIVLYKRFVFEAMFSELSSFVEFMPLWFAPFGWASALYTYTSVGGLFRQHVLSREGSLPALFGAQLYSTIGRQNKRVATNY